MKRVVIIGAGGHAQVVADMLLRARDAGQPVEPIGYLDDSERIHGTWRLGIQVLGCIADLPSIPHDAVVIAIGDNRTRRLIFERLRRAGEEIVVARHPNTTIAPDAHIGAGSVICAGAIVGPGTMLGENVIVNTASSIDHHSLVHDHAHICPGVHTGGEVQIGEECLVGIGASILPRRRVGARTVVGAGAVVTRDLPPGVVAMGVPARVVRQLSEEERSYPPRG